MIEKWCEDEEYMFYVEDFLEIEVVKKLVNYIQYVYFICLEYFISVFYYSYLFVKKWGGNVKVIVCVGFLYDLFYYDWCMMKFDEGIYVYIYLRIVVKNVEKIIELLDFE